MRRDCLSAGQEKHAGKALQFAFVITSECEECLGALHTETLPVAELVVALNLHADSDSMGSEPNVLDVEFMGPVGRHEAHLK